MFEDKRLNQSILVGKCGSPFVSCCGRLAHDKGITFSSIPFDHGYGHAEDRYCRDELELSINLVMGRAYEASTSLQGIACNMAILAWTTGGKRPKSAFWPTRMELI